MNKESVFYTAMGVLALIMLIAPSFEMVNASEEYPEFQICILHENSEVPHETADLEVTNRRTGEDIVYQNSGDGELTVDCSDFNDFISGDILELQAVELEGGQDSCWLAIAAYPSWDGFSTNLYVNGGNSKGDYVIGNAGATDTTATLSWKSPGSLDYKWDKGAAAFVCNMKLSYSWGATVVPDSESYRDYIYAFHIKITSGGNVLSNFATERKRVTNPNPNCGDPYVEKSFALWWGGTSVTVETWCIVQYKDASDPGWTTQPTYEPSPISKTFTLVDPTPDP